MLILILFVIPPVLAGGSGRDQFKIESVSIGSNKVDQKRILLVEGLVAQFLFVVGSFAEGMVHFSRIQSFVEGRDVAQAKGKLYKLKVGFPVFTINSLFIVLS